MMGQEQTTTASTDEDHGSFFCGVSLEKDAEGRVVALATRARRDKDRWDATTPSFAAFPELRTIHLSKCRYLDRVDESLVQLKHLQTLRLTRCSKLKSLPDAIGQLVNLQEVC